MLIAIISDIHDNLVNLKKCLSWCKQENVDQLICCGDVTNRETLNFLATHFSSTIHLVKGNMEIYNEQEVKQYNNIKYYGKVGKVELESKTVGICHEPFLIDKLLKSSQGYDMIFYGHTHKPWQDKKNKIKSTNPGNIAGVLHKATFATWDTQTNKLKLILLELL